jgi:hypothetical protein
MTVAVNVTIEANTVKEAKITTIDSLLQSVSEFDRQINMVEDITPTKPKVKLGIVSY